MSGGYANTNGDAQGDCTVNAGGIRCDVGTSITVPASGASVNELSLLAERTGTSVIAIAPTDYDYHKTFPENISLTDDILVSNFTNNCYSVAVLPENPNAPTINPIEDPTVLTKALGGVRVLEPGQAVRVNAYCPSYVVTIDAELDNNTISSNFTMGQLNGKSIYVRQQNSGALKSVIDDSRKSLLMGSYEIINETDAVLNHRLTPQTPKNLERELQRLQQDRWLVPPKNLVDKSIIPPHGEDRFYLPGDYVKVYILSQTAVQGNEKAFSVRPLTRNYQTTNTTQYCSFLVSPGDSIALGFTNCGGLNGLVGQIAKCMLIPRGNLVFKGNAIAFNQ